MMLRLHQGMIALLGQNVLVDHCPDRSRDQLKFRTARLAVNEDDRFRIYTAGIPSFCFVVSDAPSPRQDTDAAQVTQQSSGQSTGQQGSSLHARPGRSPRSVAADPATCSPLSIAIWVTKRCPAFSSGPVWEVC